MRATLLCLFLAGCSGPSLTATLVEVAPLRLDPSRPDGSDITFRVRYHSAGGNLGDGTARIRDCRAPELVTELALPAIASEAAVQAGVAIEGELDLTVVHVGAIESPSLSPACAALGVTAQAHGQVVFCVELADAAGNRSNAPCSAPVTIAGD